MESGRLRYKLSTDVPILLEILSLKLYTFMHLLSLSIREAREKGGLGRLCAGGEVVP